VCTHLRCCAGYFNFPFESRTVKSNRSNALNSYPVERWIGKESESAIGITYWNGWPKEAAQAGKQHIQAVRLQWVDRVRNRWFGSAIYRQSLLGRGLKAI
jgi:hypothetical protein